MKIALCVLLAAGAVLAVVVVSTSRRENVKHAARVAELQAQWDTERAELEIALAHARQQARLVRTSALPTSTPVLEEHRLSPAEIIERLRSLRLSTGASTTPVLRQAVYWLEELTLAGQAALPAIGEFLGRYEDTDLETSFFQSKNVRPRVPLDFTLPPSLRFGLFDVVRRIGGGDAESMLLESLRHTGRGVEVSYLAAALEEMAPGKYRDDILAVTRSLLADTSVFNAVSPLDRGHREYLFGVLLAFGDAGFAGEAQAQLVRADSQVDRGALKYLQETLGPKAVPILEQAYQNPSLTNSAGKEPLARLALAYVGADPHANQFYEKTINDPLLNKSHRKNLIEDLNQDGFKDTKNLGASDLPLIENRIALIEQLAPSAMDEANAAAFREAYKDLVNMRTKASSVSTQKP